MSKNENALKMVWDAFEALKIESYIEDKNLATKSNINKRTNISRNNFSIEYTKKYPLWKELRDSIDNFKTEFEENKRTPKNSKIKRLQKELTKTQKELNNSLSQNLSLIKEISEKNSLQSIIQKKLDITREENQKLELEIKKYIEKYGLL